MCSCISRRHTCCLLMDCTKRSDKKGLRIAHNFHRPCEENRVKEFFPPFPSRLQIRPGAGIMEKMEIFTFFCWITKVQLHISTKLPFRGTTSARSNAAGWTGWKKKWKKRKISIWVDLREAPRMEKAVETWKPFSHMARNFVEKLLVCATVHQARSVLDFSAELHRDTLKPRER